MTGKFPYLLTGNAMSGWQHYTAPAGQHPSVKYGGSTAAVVQTGCLCCDMISECVKPFMSGAQMAVIKRQMLVIIYIALL